MRKIKEVLRLRWLSKLTFEKISDSCVISQTAARDYVTRARSASLNWDAVQAIDEEGLEALLFPNRSSGGNGQKLAGMNFADFHMNLRKKSVTKLLLWHEYRERNPAGYSYSQLCLLYREYLRKTRISLRHTHTAGEKMFVDYAGQTVPIYDAITGDVNHAQIFIACLGASQYTYAEAQPSQSLPCWIDGHIHAFEFFGGCPEIVVPDNLRAGVSRACRYEPDLNPTYHDLAKFYDVAVIPTRVKKPKDKAKVENAVLLCERWILAVIRNRKFFSIAELNEAILELLIKLNEKPFQKLPGSRKSVFETLDRPALKPLPQEAYEFAEIKLAGVNIDYHIVADGHYYSVPYTIIGEEVLVKLRRGTVEIFHKNRRVALHKRSYVKGGYTTALEHRPKAHQKYLEWSPARLLRWAATVGPHTEQICATIMAERDHPEQGFRSCMGIFRLSERYGNLRAEAAARRAIYFSTNSYKAIKKILLRNLDQAALPNKALAAPPVPEATIHHENVRGGDYYTHNISNEGEANDDYLSNIGETCANEVIRDSGGTTRAACVDRGPGA